MRSRSYHGRGGTSDGGFILIVVLGIMMTLVMLCVTFLSVTSMQAEMGVFVADSARCDMAAWSAVDWLIANISTDAFDPDTGEIKPDWTASRKAWWYKEYRPLQSSEHTSSEDWDYQSAIDGRWRYLNPAYEALWMYFPDAELAKIPDSQIRLEIHLVDENAFINVNDWLYDHAPTAAQMANVFVNQIPVSYLERDYMFVNGYVDRTLSGGLPSSENSATTPKDDREYARYYRARLKPVEAFMVATAAQRAIKVLRAGHPTDAAPMQQAPSNRCYGHMEGGNVVWDNSYWGVLNMLRYFQDGHWNTVVNGTVKDNSSGENLFGLARRTERCGAQDPDTGCSAINLNTAARSGEGELYASWARHSGGPGSAANVIEGVVPVESLWQLLIVNPADTDNGTAAGSARVIVSDELLEKFMTDNPEIAGPWNDPDKDGSNDTNGGGFGGTDDEDNQLYKEAREELVERMAWELSFQYQEAICRWLMGCWYDLRDYGDRGHWGYPPDRGLSVMTQCRSNSYLPSGWDLDYLERYPWTSAGDLPSHYALKGNSVGGDALGCDREDDTRWPFGRAEFWTEIRGGLSTLSSGTMTNPQYTATGASTYLGDKVGVTVDAAGNVVFEILPGKIDRWIADAVYNSVRPGPNWSIYGSNPLKTLSDNEDNGCFDSAFKTAWDFAGLPGDSTANAEFHGWRADNTAGANFGIRYPAAALPAYAKFATYAPDPAQPAFELQKVYGNRYSYRWFVDKNGNGVEDSGDDPDDDRICLYPPRNMYLFNYDSAEPQEQEPPGMVPRSLKAGKDGTTRRQYWRKQFTPNTFATEISNTSTSFRFAATAQVVDPEDPAILTDDRVYYERRIAGWLEIAPDAFNETMAGEMGALTANKDCGPWYVNGMPAYWRSRLNFEGWRRVSSHSGHGWDAHSQDMQHKDAHRRHGDPRYRLGEHPLGQHDRWYDYRGWHKSYYQGAKQTKKRIQFLHFIDNNLK